MEIIEIHSLKDDEGFFPLPTNLINPWVFTYPSVGFSHWEIERNKRINVIICYLGRLFKDETWRITMMGYDCFLYTVGNNKEVRTAQYANYTYFDGNFLIKYTNNKDWEENYIKTNKMVLRMEKLYKIKYLIKEKYGRTT